MKHRRQLEESRASSQSAIKELEQLQNEKRKMLMEHETTKLKELDEAYALELKDWKNQLKPRKQVKRIKVNLAIKALSRKGIINSEISIRTGKKLCQFSNVIDQ